MIKFSNPNSKLKLLQERIGRKVYSYDILSGVNCPGAQDCKAWAERTSEGLRIVDGPDTEFRCFSASQEAQYPDVFAKREANQEVLMAKDSDTMADMLLAAMPSDAEVVRIHVSGDFRTLAYFDAWLEVARRRPDVRFYAYTKSIPFWVRRKDSIPANFALTASRGGRWDHLIDEHGFREARVVYSAKEAKRLRLVIDHNDYHAYRLRGGSFALLIHGTQPKGSEAGKAAYALRGVSTYAR